MLFSNTWATYPFDWKVIFSLKEFGRYWLNISTAHQYRVKTVFWSHRLGKGIADIFFSHSPQRCHIYISFIWLTVLKHTIFLCIWLWISCFGNWCLFQNYVMQFINIPMFSLCQQTNKTIPSKIEISSDWMQFSVFATIGRHTAFRTSLLIKPIHLFHVHHIHILIKF